MPAPDPASEESAIDVMFVLTLDVIFTLPLEAEITLVSESWLFPVASTWAAVTDVSLLSTSSQFVESALGAVVLGVRSFFAA